MGRFPPVDIGLQLILVVSGLVTIDRPSNAFAPAHARAASFSAVMNCNACDVSMEISRPHIETAEKLTHVEQAASNQMAHAIDRFPPPIDSQKF